MKLGTFDPNKHEIFGERYARSITSIYPTFEKFFDAWLDEKKIRSAPSTYRTYNGMGRLHMLPYFGSTPINELTKQAFEKWLRQLINSVSRAYANDCLRSLKSIMKDAHDDYEFDSKIHPIKPLRIAEALTDIEDEIFTLIQLSRLFYASNPRFRAMRRRCLSNDGAITTTPSGRTVRLATGRPHHRPSCPTAALNPSLLGGYGLIAARQTTSKV